MTTDGRSLRDEALHYHDFPAREAGDPRHQAAGQRARPERAPIRPAWPRPARRSPTTRGCKPLHRARQPRRRGHQRLRRAGSGQYRPARVQAGDGRQGRPVQEIRQYRLFRHRAGRDRPGTLADIVCALEPTFGAINLEDIKAPDCFIVEKLCRERMNIPVFHDDQHGTAIVVGAAATNALHVAGKPSRISRSSAPAAGRRASPA